MGSYFLVINAQYQSEQAQLIQSTLVNILPNKDYQLPEAVIKIDSQKSTDPLIDILKLNFKNPLQFDATESKAPSSQITSYLWDFGDRQSGNQAKVTHQYDLSQVSIQLFPVLRIKDQNGFLADTFVELENQTATDQQFAAATSSTTSKLESNNLEKYKLPGTVILGVILLGVVFYIRKRR
jgi:hypothetical protein